MQDSLVLTQLLRDQLPDSTPPYKSNATIHHFSVKVLPSAVLLSRSWTLVPKGQVSIPISYSKQIHVVQVAQCLGQWTPAYLQG